MFNKGEALLILALFVSLYAYAHGQNISDEARRHFDRGMTAVEMAKSPEDLNAAINEFKQATVLAPNWADAFYNLGKVQGAAEKYNDAIVSYRRYLQLAPDASDSEYVKSQINSLEYKAEQVLTIPEIVNVLVSFTSSDWTPSQGACQRANLAIRSANIPAGVPEDSVSVGQPLGGVYDTRAFPDGFAWEAKKVSGQIFQYKSQHAEKGICGGDPRSAGQYVLCPWMEIEIEVASRTRVKVRQKIVKLWGIDSPYVGKTYQCEYKKAATLSSAADHTDAEINHRVYSAVF